MAKRYWKDICTLVYGKGLRDYLVTKDDINTVPVYGTNGPIGWTKESLCKTAGIVIGRKGAYRGVHFSSEPFFVIDTAYYLNLTNPDVDLKWAYYKLLTVDLNRLDSGSAIPSTSRDSFYSIPVDFPSLKVQKKIAGILSSYDDLIKLNERKITLLEESARMTYKEWFVDFRFPGHEKVKIVNGVPEGWRKDGTIGDLASVLSGYAFKSRDWLSEGNPVIKIKNITESGTVNIDVCDCVNDLVASNVQRFEVYEGDLLIAMTGATVGKVGTVPFLSKRHFLNQRVGKFIAKDESSKNFIFSFCRSNAFQVAVINLAGGAAQPNISAKQIESIKCVTPPGPLLNKYNVLTNPMRELREKLIKQNKFLMEGRDILLPRLMNGDIEL